ncbi:type II secretion system protein [Candidatus Daviesbacteria bacterium]|nr:type II secretion system protein [Candidatus Daviesbacteria bacterium]
MQKILNKKGFTLVEMLVVIAILGIFGLMMSVIYIRSLKGSYKSEVLSAIKRNGQQVLEVMDKTIRNADNIVCVNNAFTTNDRTLKVIVVEKEGKYTRFSYIPPVTSSPKRNGYIAQDNLDYDPNELPSTLCAENIEQASSTYKVLTDSTPAAGSGLSVSVTDAEITSDKLAGFKDLVTISLSIEEGVSISSDLAGEISPETFQTTIQLR